MRNYHVRLLDIKTATDAAALMQQIGTDIQGVSLMKNKMVHYNFRVGPLPAAAANIIKQEMLSVGGEAAVTRGVINCSVNDSDAILSATRKQFRKFCQKLRAQPFSLALMAEQIQSALRIQGKSTGLPFSCRGVDVDLKQQSLIMGILNVTPDSFSDGNRFFTSEDALVKARRLISEGADILDIGGESTRPGATRVEENEELKRVLPVIEALRREFPKLPLSIDTCKSRVAATALDAGADIINDISAFNFDPEMAAVAASTKAYTCIMHIQKDPDTMQKDPTYSDLFAEVCLYFEKSITLGIKAGVKRERLILDPGIGFGKTLEHNLLLLKHLKEFTGFGLPLLIGTSRKSFIGKLTGDPVDQRLFASLATVAQALTNGANIVRVHDVAATKQALTVIDAINHTQR
ncbi:MAG: dihydropteroate synthase [Deltaproteobacteria bacterium]|nr:dihydropteroate synthase [Deltaproteobacteria bacterium]